MQDWCRILDIFVKPGSPREINLPAEERDDLIDYPYDPKPPPPEALQPAMRRMYDLMSDSIFIPFCNSLKSSTRSKARSAGSGLSQSPETYDTFSSSSRRSQSTRRRPSPPSVSSPHFEHYSSPQKSSRGAATSALTQGLANSSHPRITTHISNSTTVSEGALSDDSSNNDNSPTYHDRKVDMFLSPPTTPPQSDMPASSAPTLGTFGPSTNHKVVRHDSGGGWRKIGTRIFGNKKK